MPTLFRTSQSKLFYAFTFAHYRFSAFHFLRVYATQSSTVPLYLCSFHYSSPDLRRYMHHKYQTFLLIYLLRFHDFFQPRILSNTGIRFRLGAETKSRPSEDGPVRLTKCFKVERGPFRSAGGISDRHRVTSGRLRTLSPKWGIFKPKRVLSKWLMTFSD